MLLKRDVAVGFRSKVEGERKPCEKVNVPSILHCNGASIKRVNDVWRISTDRSYQGKTVVLKNTWRSKSGRLRFITVWNNCPYLQCTVLRERGDIWLLIGHIKYTCRFSYWVRSVFCQATHLFGKALGSCSPVPVKGSCRWKFITRGCTCTSPDLQSSVRL